MAEIHLTAVTKIGPVVPTKHRTTLNAVLKDKTWPGGGTLKQLQLLIGEDTVTIWPANPDEIRALGMRLVEIAEWLGGNVMENSIKKEK
jgi:hypothetical protein